MTDQMQLSQSASSAAVSFASIGVRHTTINEAPGVSLNPQQKLAVGSVLDVRDPNYATIERDQKSVPSQQLATLTFIYPAFRGPSYTQTPLTMES
jgi:hypothetical protein